MNFNGRQNQGRAGPQRPLSYHGHLLLKQVSSQCKALYKKEENNILCSTSGSGDEIWDLFLLSAGSEGFEDAKAALRCRPHRSLNASSSLEWGSARQWGTRHMSFKSHLTMGKPPLYKGVDKNHRSWAMRAYLGYMWLSELCWLSSILHHNQYQR